MTIEEIILKHGQRGMDVLKTRLEPDFCSKAAKKIFSLERGNILLATGFYVAGYAETDGPAGTFFLAKTLKEIGFSPIIITDKFCRGFFDGGNFPTVYLEKGFDEKKVLTEYSPAALISIERCGENIHGDYANMRGVSIKENTVEIDRLFDTAYEKGIYTVGVGDGGNEIGMGNLQDVITNELTLTPCKTIVSDLIIATVSNWGAYGLIAELSISSGKNLFPSHEEVDDYIKHTVKLGSVDGVKKEQIPTVDGYPPETEKEIINLIHDYINMNLI